MTDPESLDDLLIDEEALNQEILAGTVGRYLRIGKESGDLYPEAPYEELDAGGKVAVTLLAHKARYELGMVEEQRLGPSKISNLSGVKKGTVYPKVRELEDDGISRSEDGMYWIPTAKIRAVSEYIEGGET